MTFHLPSAVLFAVAAGNICVIVALLLERRRLRARQIEAANRVDDLLHMASAQNWPAMARALQGVYDKLRAR